MSPPRVRGGPTKEACHARGTPHEPHLVNTRAPAPSKRAIEQAEYRPDKRGHKRITGPSWVPPAGDDLEANDGEGDIIMIPDLFGRSRRGKPGCDSVGHNGEMRAVWKGGTLEGSNRGVELRGDPSEVLAFEELVNERPLRQSVASGASASAFCGWPRDPIRSSEKRAEGGFWCAFGDFSATDEIRGREEEKFSNRQ